MDNIHDVDVSSLVVMPVPEQDEWRVNLLKNLLSERKNNSGFLSEEEGGVSHDKLYMLHLILFTFYLVSQKN